MILLLIFAIADIVVVVYILAVKDSVSYNYATNKFALNFYSLQSSLYDSANVTFKNYLSQEDAKTSWNHVQETVS